jgi:uncharacterized iron-regulated protein
METFALPPSSPGIKEEITFQRAAVARLKREIVGDDRNSGQRRYIREFHDEFKFFEEIASLDDLTIACYKADIVYIGDYHALPDSQRFAAWLLRDIASRSREVVLCMEMVYGRSQRSLDRFMKNEISEADFLKAIRYDLEWGYDWDAFRSVFEVAREYDISVFGIDCMPRTGFRFIRKRDAYAAARVADIIERRPHAKVVLLIGESHLARHHLPGKVTANLKRKGIEKRGVLVLQNLEEIYWQLSEQGLNRVDAVRLGPDRYCRFNASPIAKYEAYRHILEVWRGDAEDEGRVDLTSTVYSMIDTILRFLHIDKYSYCVRKEERGGSGARGAERILLHTAPQRDRHLPVQLDSRGRGSGPLRQPGAEGRDLRRRSPPDAPARSLLWRSHGGGARLLRIQADRSGA